MKTIVLKTNYCKKPNQIKSARALGYAMHAVKINRIFSKADLLELLIRFQLMFPDCDLPNNYFHSPYLFSYNLDDDGMMEYYTTEDLINNFGIEINESVYEISREGFLQNIRSLRSNSVLGGILTFGCVLIPLKKEFPEEIKIIDKGGEEDKVGIIDDAKIAAAEKLAGIIVGSVSEKEFVSLKKRTVSRRIKIEKEIANKPTVKFDLAAISIDLKQKIYEHVANKYDNMRDASGNPDEQCVEWGNDLMKLIWLFANSFIDVGTYSWVNEHFEADFNYDCPIYADADEIGPNLNEARQLLQIDQFFPDFKIENK